MRGGPSRRMTTLTPSPPPIWTAIIIIVSRKFPARDSKETCFYSFVRPEVEGARGHGAHHRGREAGVDREGTSRSVPIFFKF